MGDILVLIMICFCVFVITTDTYSPVVWFCVCTRLHTDYVD